MVRNADDAAGRIKPAGIPFVVGIGGSNRAGSLTDQLLRAALAEASKSGAQTVMFGGSYLARLPVFDAEEPSSDDNSASELIRAVAEADGLLIGTPGYHGGMSGLVKNALDHLELLRDDPRPYLDGRAVGLIVTAAGWQAVGSTLVALRSTIHALRGWPTPFGVTINSAERVLGDDGEFTAAVARALHLVATQVVEFARWRQRSVAQPP
jgi:FMN reductase